MTFNGDLDMSYGQFIQAFFSEETSVFAQYQSGIWPHIDVNHLWFIRALWQFSLALLLFLPLLNSKWVNQATDWLFKQNSLVAILLSVFPIFMVQINWDMDTVRYPMGFLFMVYGYLIGWNKMFWNRISQPLKPLLLTSILCYLSFIVFYNFVWLQVIQGGEISNAWLGLAGMFNYSLMRVLGVLSLFSLAHKYLNRKSAFEIHSFHHF